MKYIDSKEFVEGLCRGINIVIGDNGTGKSHLFKKFEHQLILSEVSHRRSVPKGRMFCVCRDAVRFGTLLPVVQALGSDSAGHGAGDEELREFLGCVGCLAGGVLIWDDPALHIDPSRYPIIAEVFAILAARGVQIVIATHSLALVRWVHIYAEGAGVKNAHLGLEYRHPDFEDRARIEPAVPLRYCFIERQGEEMKLFFKNDLYDRPSAMVQAEEAWDRCVIKCQARKYVPRKL